MTTRIIVGLVALPLVLIPVWLGGIWCALLFLVIGIIGGLEFYNLMAVGDYRPSRWLGLVWLATLVLNGWQPQYFPLSLLLVVGLIAALVDALRQEKSPANTWMSTSMGAIYIGVMIGQALAIRQLPDGLWWLLFGLVVTWLNDTAAYFTGVTIGKHKLWPRLSPKKTWEGTIGGWIGAGISGGLVVWLTPIGSSILFGVALGTVCGVLALLGDLSISMLKRQVGVKDTGNLLPGHGGVLDRIDSLLFVLPFVYQVLVLGILFAT